MLFVNGELAYSLGTHENCALAIHMPQACSLLTSQDLFAMTNEMYKQERVAQSFYLQADPITLLTLWTHT